MLRQRSQQDYQSADASQSNGQPANTRSHTFRAGLSNGDAFNDDELRVNPFSYSAGMDTERDKIALVLAGGGITGVMYEIGALRAIDDLLVDLSVNDFDIFVGTSAGALVAALIANGVTPRETMQVIDNRHPELRAFQVADVFRFNIEDFLQRVMGLPRIFSSIWRNSLAQLNDFTLFDVIWDLAAALPNGIYNGAALELFVRTVLEKTGRTNTFSQLGRELYIVASELDSGRRAVFGPKYSEDMPISLAVAASSAVPVLYRPVQVFEKDYLDGSLHGNASLDLAIEAGAKLVVCINPMVPFDASLTHPHEHYIRNNGLQAIINQSVRTLLHSSLRYHIKNLRSKYPDVDIILIQPGLDDYEMFSYNPMHYSGRLGVAEHGFESVTKGLLSNIDYYRGILSRHNIALHTDLLTAELRALKEHGKDIAIAEEVIRPPKRTLNSAISRLEVSLKRLEDAVTRMEKVR